MKKTTYVVRTMDTYRVLKTCKTYGKALEWALDHDYGQWELEGGLVIEARVAESLSSPQATLNTSLTQARLDKPGRL